MAETLEERFMLVARGVETEEMRTRLSDSAPVIIVRKHWMRFRSAYGQEFTVYREFAKDLPEVDIGDLRWFRLSSEEVTDNG
jgi:hypothetical protein